MCLCATKIDFFRNFAPVTAEEKYRDFLSLAAASFSAQSTELIRRALVLLDEKLAPMTRYNGAPLADHSVGTAAIVISEIGLGRNSTIATLLHDVVRLGLLTSKEVGEQFGMEVGLVIDGLTNISGIHAKIADEQADNIRELIMSYSTDPRVILIKLADRLEVMRTLDMFPHEKQERKSWESLNLYSKIAHQLGLYNIKSELEDLSLKYLHPDDYRHITRKLEETSKERDKLIEKLLVPVEEKLKRENYVYSIKSRTKSVYSIWRKMQKQRVPFEEVYDVFALRIIIDCPREEEKPACWGVYSVVTDFYEPNIERLRDWITVPKSNGYESLQTTVQTPDGKWVEIQIRTRRMDEVAERGIAAHWRYKGVTERSAGGEVFVFTPEGDLMRLGEGATVLDFAFHIHTLVGASCIGGKVNGKNVTIRHSLHNGDRVEILTSRNQRPKADWLGIVKTSRAKSKIRAYMREAEARAANLGREELQRKIKNWKLSIAIDDAVTALCKHYKLRTGTELYGRIADGSVDIAEVKEVLVRHLCGDEYVSVRNLPPVPRPAETAADDVLVIDDQSVDMSYRFGKCCSPLPGDEVFGFVTVAGGITVHRKLCPNAARMLELYPYRVLQARWRSKL